MIPKIIHFCWLSNDPYPKEIRQCMDSWKKVMPDYEIKLWNMETFDVSSAPVYVQEAVKARKWAFAADYIRMYALYTEGGIYLDSDVKILKRFDDFLHYFPAWNIIPAKLNEMEQWLILIKTENELLTSISLVFKFRQQSWELKKGHTS